MLKISPAVQTALDKVGVSLQTLESPDHITAERFNAVCDQLKEQRETIISEMTDEQRVEILSLGRTIRTQINEHEQTIVELGRKLLQVQKICNHKWNTANCIGCGISARD